MEIRKVVGFVVVFGLCLMGIMLGSPLVVFLDVPSALIFGGVVAGGVLLSHSLGDLRAAAGTYFSSGPLDAQHAHRDQSTFLRLAALSGAAAWVGVFIGLIQMLQNLDDPAKIGPAMAVALLTMFYGVVGSEVVFRPAAADCLARSRTGTEVGSGPSVLFSVRKLVATALIGGTIVSAIIVGGPLVVFFDVTSALIVVMATAFGILLSHSIADVRQNLGAYFGPEQMSEPNGRRAAAMFGDLASLAVGIGLVGTLIGLVQMLQNLEDPSAIGPALAVGLLTLFYGVFLSEVLFRSAAADCLRRSGLSADEVSDQMPNRTVGSIAALFVVLFTFAMMLLAMADWQ